VALATVGGAGAGAVVAAAGAAVWGLTAETIARPARLLHPPNPNVARPGCSHLAMTVASRAMSSLRSWR
jgi:hypothetical protein